jgi:hypothetical protein
MEMSTGVSSTGPKETGCGQPRQDASQPKALVDLATSTAQVSAFCQAVLSNLVPDEFWGKDTTLCHNKTIFLGKVDHFVKLRRFEGMTLHEICQGMKVCFLPATASHPKASAHLYLFRLLIFRGSNPPACKAKRSAKLT